MKKALVLALAPMALALFAQSALAQSAIETAFTATVTTVVNGPSEVTPTVERGSADRAAQHLKAGLRVPDGALILRNHREIVSHTVPEAVVIMQASQTQCQSRWMVVGGLVGGAVGLWIVSEPDGNRGYSWSRSQKVGHVGGGALIGVILGSVPCW